ncbi:hypothetical protein TUBRATIS_000470 [Tubulinosema ratisbonensis]|uniref:Uncharacterized protein n=1 Tax=Tubulinosema ratisbonensis TaxID=291195 RepID=A0A437AQH6_9MICR|nr:hypothetical protein TUBRATIS_000470 [Tubulinosema ratisbonensis]
MSEQDQTETLSDKIRQKGVEILKSWINLNGNKTKMIEDTTSSTLDDEFSLFQFLFNIIKYGKYIIIIIVCIIIVIIFYKILVLLKGFIKCCCSFKKINKHQQKI